MKVDELMTGVFVYFNCFDGSKIVVCVTGFKGKIVYGDSEKSSHWCSIEKVEPILLTPEIFEKNGFIKQGADGWEYIHPDDSTYSYISYRILYRTYYDNNLFIKKYKGSSTSATLQISYINFVHQLQYALRLCGIEKEIEL